MISFVCVRLLVLVAALTVLLIATSSAETNRQRVRRQLNFFQPYRPVQQVYYYYTTPNYCYGTVYTYICPYNTCLYSATRNSCCVAQLLGYQGVYCLCSSPTCSAVDPALTSTSTTSTTPTTSTTTPTSPTTTPTTPTTTPTTPTTTATNPTTTTTTPTTTATTTTATTTAGNAANNG